MKFLEISVEILAIILLLCAGVVQKNARAEYGTEVMSRKRGFVLFLNVGVAVAAIVALTLIIIDVMPVFKAFDTTESKWAAIGVIFIYAVGAAVAITVFCMRIRSARRTVKESFQNYDRAEARKLTLLLFCVGAWAWFRLSWIWIVAIISLISGKGLSMVFDEKKE